MLCGASVHKTADRWHCIEAINYIKTVGYVLKWKRFLWDTLKTHNNLLGKNDFLKKCFQKTSKICLVWLVHHTVFHRWSTKIFRSQFYTLYGRTGF